MPGKEKVLVVVDPSHETHPALQRAVLNASIRKEAEQSSLVILVLPDSEALSKDTSIHQTGDWLQALLEPVKTEGLEYHLELCWSGSWSSSILSAVDKHHIDVVMLPFYAHGNGKVLSDDNWHFLRNSQTPVLLVRPDSDPSRQTILAAIKIQDDNYQELNHRIITRGKWAAERYDAQLHVVNCYSDSLNFPDRAAISRLAEVPNECIHVKSGAPGDVIPKLAAELNADNILIGTTRRSGLKAALRGNTIEKIIGDIPQDVMMLV